MPLLALLLPVVLGGEDGIPLFGGSVDPPRDDEEPERHDGQRRGYEAHGSPRPEGALEGCKLMSTVFIVDQKYPAKSAFFLHLPPVFIVVRPGLLHGCCTKKLTFEPSANSGRARHRICHICGRRGYAKTWRGGPPTAATGHRSSARECRRKAPFALA